VELAAEPRKRKKGLLSLVFDQNLCIDYVSLVFLSAVGVFSCCLSLGLKGSNLIFLLLCKS